MLLAVRPLLITFLAARAHQFAQLVFDIQHSVAPIDDDELLVRLAAIVHAIAEPAEAVGDFSEPRRLLLPVNFFDVLDRIE